jgi:hypothetical protein
MDSDDATLCLDNIRSVCLVVNKIRKMIVRKIGGAGGNTSATSSSSSFPNTSIHPTLFDQESLQSLRLQISDLDTKLDRTSLEILNTCIPPTMNESTSVQSLELGESSLAPLDNLYNWSGLNKTSLTLLLAFLGVWLLVVLLALLWMRLHDLRFKPQVVSENLCFYNILIKNLLPCY